MDSTGALSRYIIIYIYIYIYIYTVLSTKRVEWVVFQSFDIFSVMVHAIETKTYQHDPQGLLINLISMIIRHVIVT